MTVAPIKLEIDAYLLEKLALINYKKYIKTIAFCELDSRILTAMQQIEKIGFAKTALVYNKKKFLSFCYQHKFQPADFNLIDASDEDTVQKFVSRLLVIRKHKNITETEAVKMVAEPLIFAALMLEDNTVDALVAGAQHATSSVIRAALHIIGLSAETKVLSSFFLMQQHPLLQQITSENIPNKLLLADCAINIEPSVEQLVDIVVATAKNAQQLLDEEVRIALLSFSTNGSANSERAQMIKTVTNVVHEKYPRLLVDGEMQLDTAINFQVRKQKFPNCKLADKPANVLIFPNLEAGNIGYKLLQRFAGSIAIGPVLQGLNKPINDLSRGCSISEIVLTSIVSCIQIFSIQQ